MSTPVQSNLSTTMDAFSSLPKPGMEAIIEQVESVKKVRFAFHPWIPHNNFGSDGFRFNIPYAVLERLVPIPLMVFQYPVVIPPKSFAFLGSAPIASNEGNQIGAIPSAGSRSNIKQAQQLPEQSMSDLHTAYGKFGMVELKSLAASDEAGFARSSILFEAVMGSARLIPDPTDADYLVSDPEELKAGRRDKGLLLEEFPDWLARDAMRAYRYALKNGVVIKGKSWRVEGDQAAAERLIQEVHASIMQAHEMALSPSIGILPQTRDLRNMSANKIPGGKNYYDNVDLWLLEQFPSFEIDTDSERAQKALQGAMKNGADATQETGATIAAVLQNQQKTIEMLAEGQLQTQELIRSLVPKGKRAE